MGTDNSKPTLSRWLRIAVIGRNPRITLVRIIALVIIAFLSRAYVLAPIKVVGGSMMPTYQEDGINFVNRLAYLRAEPQRGDVVAIRFAGSKKMLLKRVIGLPGESVRFHRGRVVIDGEPLEEPYLDPVNYPCDWEMAPRKIGPGEYYVVGDNRSMPKHLHQEGVASRNRIIGRILLCKNLFASSSSEP